MSKFLAAILSITILFLSGNSYSQKEDNSLSTVGPEKGTLIIIGGGHLDEMIYNRFKEDAGGDTAEIVVIPTAMPDEFLEKDSALINIQKGFERYGFKKVTILHTRNKDKANDEGFIKPLKTATGIYFMGGRQWRIADGFLNTKAHKEMVKLLDRGGVIAGSSAGATIQGSYLARGDTKNNQIMCGDHEQGLGFLKNTAIDQHVLVRNRQFDMFDILKKYPDLLGLSIDENTAIVVNGNEFEVIGASYVLVYDNSFWSREGSDLKTLPSNESSFYFLKNGDKYNMEERKVINN